MISNKRKAREGSDSESADAFRNDLPDRPLKRFLIGFACGAPLAWVGALGYSQTSMLGEMAIALTVGTGLGLIGAFGKRPLAWVLNFLIHG